MANPTVMTPAVEARAMALAGTHNRKEASRILGVPYDTMKMWSRRHNVTFLPGRPGRKSADREAPRRDDSPKARAPKRRTVLTPERIVRALELRAEGVCGKDVAERIGVPQSTLARWASEHKLKFPDGRKGNRRRHVYTEAFLAAARVNVRKASRASAENRRLRLSESEMRQYRTYREKARVAGVHVTRDDALRAIGRPDLVGAC